MSEVAAQQKTQTITVSPVTATLTAPQMPEHWGFHLTSWPLRFSLWLNDHVEWLEYLTYDSGNYLPGQLIIVYESTSSLKTLFIKLPLN